MHKLLFGDCRSYKNEIPNNAIIVTDPPFNIGYKYRTYKDRMKEDEYLQFLSEILGGVELRL